MSTVVRTILWIVDFNRQNTRRQHDVKNGYIPLSADTTGEDDTDQTELDLYAANILPLNAAPWRIRDDSEPIILIPTPSCVLACSKVMFEQYT